MRNMLQIRFSSIHYHSIWADWQGFSNRDFAFCQMEYHRYFCKHTTRYNLYTLHLFCNYSSRYLNLLAIQNTKSLHKEMLNLG